MPYHRDTFSSLETFKTCSSRAITAGSAAQVISYYLVDFTEEKECTATTYGVILICYFFRETHVELTEVISTLAAYFLLFVCCRAPW
jgi:hypothetical protein